MAYYKAEYVVRTKEGRERFAGFTGASTIEWEPNVIKVHNKEGILVIPIHNIVGEILIERIE